jgi:hypothetical protein
MAKKWLRRLHRSCLLGLQGVGTACKGPRQPLSLSRGMVLLSLTGAMAAPGMLGSAAAVDQAGSCRAGCHDEGRLTLSFLLCVATSTLTLVLRNSLPNSLHRSYYAAGLGKTAAGAQSRLPASLAWLGLAGHGSCELGGGRFATVVVL